MGPGSAGRGKRPQKIHALTSLRFFAALYVVFYHSLGEAYPWVVQHQIPRDFVSLGYISVSFFFLLSGYILAIVYLRSDAPIRIRQFYIARFARIYPLFCITLIAGTPFVLIERIAQYGLKRAISKTILTFGAHFLMLQAWIPNIHGIDPPNWSLSVETFFYLLFPFVGALLWRLRGARLWITAVVIWLAGQAIVIASTPHVLATTARFNPLLHLPTFAIGVLLARWQSISLHEKPEASRARRRPLAFLLLLISVIVLGSTIFLQRYLTIPSLNAGLLSPAFAVVIWFFSEDDGILGRILSAHWLVLLGEASYGLYLIHFPVLRLFETFHYERFSGLLYPLYLAVCIGLSIVSFYMLETRARHWILKHMQVRPKETLEAASDAQ